MTVAEMPSEYTKDEWEALARDMAPLHMHYEYNFTENPYPVSRETRAFLSSCVAEDKAKRDVRGEALALLNDEQKRALGVG